MTFKVGDRVRVYDWRNGTSVGAVDHITRHGELCVSFSDQDIKIFAYPKQCRRLVKKKRREYWIDIRQTENGVEPNYVLWEAEPVMNIQVRGELIHVREVKEKK